MAAFPVKAAAKTVGAETRQVLAKADGHAGKTGVKRFVEERVDGKDLIDAGAGTRARLDNGCSGTSANNIHAVCDVQVAGGVRILAVAVAFVIVSV